MKPYCVKVRYHSESIALKEAEKLFKSKGSKLRAYKCDVCSNWHLASIKQDPNKTINYQQQEIDRLKKHIDLLNQRIKNLTTNK